MSASFALVSASAEDNRRIIEVVKKVAPDFGFREDEKSAITPELITFGKGAKSKTKYSALDGSNSVISLVIGTGRFPQIFIQDVTNNYETEFMKEFKEQLEERLGEVVDMRGVQFKREFDYWN